MKHIQFFITLSLITLAEGIRIIGNCQDEYGCYPCAGYSWCNATQSCLRTWEQNCLTDSVSVPM